MYIEINQSVCVIDFAGNGVYKSNIEAIVIYISKNNCWI